MNETTASARPVPADGGTDAPATGRRIRPRISGIDFARFLALIGMMAAHAWVMDADGSPGLVSEIVSGKAAALFAVLAGAGIAFTTRSALAAGRAGAARWNLFGRGIALILIGLTLGLSPTGIVVILVYYGVMFWAAIPLLRWSNRALLIGAGVLAVVWPFLSFQLRTGLERSSDLGSASWLSLAEPLSFVRGLFLTGAYPVPTWIVYVMVGMVVGRLAMAAVDDGALRRLGLRLAGIGVVLAGAAWGVSALLAGPLGGLAALVSERPELEPGMMERAFYGTGMGAAGSSSLWFLASPAPHTGTTFDLAVTTGVALTVLGLCLALGTVLGRTARRVLDPARRAGSAPLTVYAAHVIAASVSMAIVLVTGDTAEIPWYFSSGPLWALHIAGALAIGTVLMLLGRRGPLETFVSWSGRVLSRRRSG